MIFFFFQAEDGIRDLTVTWSSDVCSSDLHNLAYVRWYKPAETSKVRYYFSIDDDEKTCNVKLWKNEFYSSYGHNSIISVQNILCRFVPVKCKIFNCQNAIEYLTINPINRKFHIY